MRELTTNEVRSVSGGQGGSLGSDGGPLLGSQTTYELADTWTQRILDALREPAPNGSGS